MDCASCAANIEYALKKEKGVLSASVNFVSEKAHVEFDEKENNPERIKKSLKGWGIKRRNTITSTIGHPLKGKANG